jgi:hypothetical protein
MKRFLSAAVMALSLTITPMAFAAAGHGGGFGGAHVGGFGGAHMGFAGHPGGGSGGGHVGGFGGAHLGLAAHGGGGFGGAHMGFVGHPGGIVGGHIGRGHFVGPRIVRGHLVDPRGVIIDPNFYGNAPESYYSSCSRYPNFYSPAVGCFGEYPPAYPSQYPAG